MYRIIYVQEVILHQPRKKPNHHHHHPPLHATSHQVPASAHIFCVRWSWPGPVWSQRPRAEKIPAAGVSNDTNLCTLVVQSWQQMCQEKNSMVHCLLEVLDILFSTNTPQY